MHNLSVQFIQMKDSNYVNIKAAQILFYCCIIVHFIAEDYDYIVLPVKNDDVCRSNGTKFMNYVFITTSPYHYLTCSNGVSEINICPPGSIFVPGKNCMDVDKHGITMGE